MRLHNTRCVMGRCHIMETTCLMRHKFRFFLDLNVDCPSLFNILHPLLKRHRAPTNFGSPYGKGPKLRGPMVLFLQCLQVTFFTFICSTSKHWIANIVSIQYLGFFQPQSTFDQTTYSKLCIGCIAQTTSMLRSKTLFASTSTKDIHRV